MSGILIKESELDSNFELKCGELLKNTELQKNLGKEIKKLALESATQDIVDEVEKLIEKK